MNAAFSQEKCTKVSSKILSWKNSYSFIGIVRTFCGKPQKRREIRIGIRKLRESKDWTILEYSVDSRLKMQWIQGSLCGRINVVRHHGRG